VSHDFLQDSRFYASLFHIDRVAADQMRRSGCRCGGPLHRSNYPRKPRGPAFLQGDSTWYTRLSFCCGRCRRRATPASVRFAGRRVYACVIVVLGCLADGKRIGAARLAALSDDVGVSARTVRRWLTWWRCHFVQTPMWTLGCARFMPPVDVQLLPTSLLARFSGGNSAALLSLLRFISPLSTNSGQAM
jgi:hypothetical protein